MGRPVFWADVIYAETERAVIESEEMRANEKRKFEEIRRQLPYYFWPLAYGEEIADGFKSIKRSTIQ